MIANIPWLLTVPVAADTSILVFVAVMVAAPADCIRSPVLLLPLLLVLLMVALLAVRVTSEPNMPEAVLLAALTALPPVLVTLTGG
ncbi:MAG: hypothetical protein ACLQU2_31540 [Candidatus Binataceae bacterium]